ncbi:MAG: cardiolipin synthase [Lachnospiraceae bacterium]|nr:cardiolipin synthase [Lachnospiraceae bacterium]
MRTEGGTSVKNSVSRLVFVGLCILVQIAWLVVMIVRLNRQFSFLNLLCEAFALILALHVYGKNENAAFKMPWIILLLVSPVLGLCFYGLFGHKQVITWNRKRFERLDEKLFAFIGQDKAVMDRLEQTDFAVANQCRYIIDYGKFPVYQNTEVVFYADAAEAFEAQLCELEKAEKFIFMEYHAIEEAQSFSRLKELFARKSKEGVEIRLLYDDVGSIGFIDKNFIKRMEAIGVQCVDFNPVLPIVNIFMNNRDHRKITVIDGEIGFTGGYNLADEYFNITHPYGHWKDTGVKLTGDAVRSLTALFLEMWNAMRETDMDFEKYLFCTKHQIIHSGYVQPYADSPLDDEATGENVYLNMIKHAKHRLYVATPYLIISDEMNRELGLAAKRGVDVRILTPGIPDKKMVYKMTRSYYAGLVCQGVRVYEYTPGFLHEKQVLCDDECATVGTINFDYRSLYHHFENGVFLYRCEAIKDIARDFEETLQKCTEVTEYYRSGRSTALRGAQYLLRLLAPLL